jgi:succinate-acetate transporter protein
MAVGNTFGATALSSYGGFWLSLAIVLTPGGFDIAAAYAVTDPTTGKATGAGVNDFNNAFGFFLIGWFIFTTVLLLCTLRSTVAFFLLFFFLDLAFLLLGIARLKSVDGAMNIPINKAGGYFGLFAAFMAWYNALAGIADDRYVPLLLHLSLLGVPKTLPWGSGGLRGGTSLPRDLEGVPEALSPDKCQPLPPPAPRMKSFQEPN